MAGGSAGPTLAGLFATLADELGGVTVKRSSGIVEYQRGDRAFAVVDGPSVDVRLRPEVAEAVQRTPQTSRSKRGPGWIRFEPPEVDQSVVDRADAWFRSAWRLAER